MTTRAQAWNHLKVVLLGLDPDDPDTATDSLKLALEQDGVNSLADFFSFTLQDINDLHFTDPTDNVERPVPRHKRAILKVVKAFNAYYCKENNVPNLDWTGISRETFDDYRVNIYDPDEPIVRYGRGNANMNNQTNPLGVGIRNPRPVQQQARQASAADIFKKGIKREKTHYKPYKTERQWDNWHRGFRATAMTHDLRNILDRTYAPTNREERELFDEQQIFLYSVFEEHLQTDMGKTLVC